MLRHTNQADSEIARVPQAVRRKDFVVGLIAPFLISVAIVFASAGTGFTDAVLAVTLLLTAVGASCLCSGRETVTSEQGSCWDRSWRYRCSTSFSSRLTLPSFGSSGFRMWPGKVRICRMGCTLARGVAAFRSCRRGAGEAGGRWLAPDYCARMISPVQPWKPGA
jgi:hypothetical protein